MKIKEPIFKNLSCIALSENHSKFLFNIKDVYVKTFLCLYSAL